MSIRPTALLLVVLAALAEAPLAEARSWSDTSGSYQVEAELVAMQDDSVILQRADHHLVEIEVATLSKEDRAYLSSEKAQLAAEKVAGQQQTWTTRGGLEIVGKAVEYVIKEVTIQRRRGKIYVNDRVLENLPDVYRKIVPRVVGHFEQKPIQDEAALKSWLIHRKGEPATYRCEGIVLEMRSGDEYAIPFFLLSEADLQVLQPSWEQWLASQGDYQSQSDVSEDLRALAAARQQDQEVTQQIARLQLAMQSVTAGVTSLWEVTLYPGPGVAGTPLWVVVPGRDSRVATNNALTRNPGYTAGPVRRVSR